MEIVIVLRAVDQEGGISGALAENRAVGVDTGQIGAGVGVHGHPRSQLDQIEVVPAVERNRVDPARGATCIVTSSWTVRSSTSTTFSKTWVLKPSRLTVTLYVPAGSASTR